MKNNTNKGNNMTKKFLTEKETEGMSLEQFAQAIREGKVEVLPEGSHKPTADQVTMNGRFGCEWVFFYCFWFVYDLHLCVCVYVRVYVGGLYVITLDLIMILEFYAYLALVIGLVTIGMILAYSLYNAFN